MSDDRAEPGGGITELAARPPEEWELVRPVGVSPWYGPTILQLAGRRGGKSEASRRALGDRWVDALAVWGNAHLFFEGRLRSGEK